MEKLDYKGDISGVTNQPEASHYYLQSTQRRNSH